MFNVLSVLRTFISTNNTESKVLNLFDQIKGRVDNWDDDDMKAVVKFRVQYDQEMITLLEEMRNLGLADDTTALRTYNIQNHPSPVLDAMNWPLFVPAVFNEEGDEKAVPWTVGSTVQAPIHLAMEDKGFASTYIDLKPLNNGRGLSERGWFTKFTKSLSQEQVNEQ